MDHFRSSCLSFLRLLLVITCFMASLEMGSSSDISVGLSDDVLGLIVFKSGLLDANSALSSWNADDQSACSWFGVECSPTNQRVTGLSLDGLSLSGNLDRGLQKLKHLRGLFLSRNNLSGTLISKLAGMPKLSSLNLSSNNLSGEIPVELTNFTRLRFLDLSENSLAGQIPENLFSNCYTLRFFSLGGNHMEGALPPSLANCSLLQVLNLSHNRLSGSPVFRGGIWSLRRLRVLDLSFNQFSGPLPVGISILHYLKELHLEGNHFEGNLPADLGQCRHLWHLDLSSNLFTGNIPDTFQNLGSLSFVNLCCNKLTGQFPLWVGNLSNLERVDFSNNELTGCLPAPIGYLKSMNSLILSNNKITGEIPEELTLCTRLSEIKLNGNILAGVIPVRLFDLDLREIDLSSNKITGNIPLGSSPLNLPENNVTGNLSLASDYSLRYLNFSWNDFNSTLPLQLGMFKNLSVLDIRRSGLHGTIPDHLCDHNSLSVLQLDGNSLTGSLPSWIEGCSSLYILSLSHNNLSGSIPNAISSLKNLKILNLEFNSLSGEIPQGLGHLDGLIAVNLSYNKLTGRLPSGGIFSRLNQSALQGNPGLCSPHTGLPCKMMIPKPLAVDPDTYSRGRNDGHMASESRPTRERRFLRHAAVIIITSVVAIVAGVIIVALLSTSTTRNASFVETLIGSKWVNSRSSGSYYSGKLVFFSPAEPGSGYLVNNAELLLSKASALGRGHFGMVYTVSVGEGTTLAVKKITSENMVQSHRVFEQEVRVLGKAVHPHVMRLLGYYWTSQQQLLISYFASNGSLQSKLHESSHDGQWLSWAIRFRIAHGTAEGLAYLHQCHPPIIHYNFKPSNILLDDNYCPMISDFGLARIFQKSCSHLPGRCSQNQGGYTAPELTGQSGTVDEKCDVYGFGLMLLELVTGRTPLHHAESNSMTLIDYIRALMDEGNVIKCVDSSLGEYPDDEVFPVLKLGLVCTSHKPSSRPSMAEVVRILQVIKTPRDHLSFLRK